jgi:hypothetical protein
MESLEANYGKEFGLRANRRRYERLQAAYVYTRQFRGTGSQAELAELDASLPVARRLVFRACYRVALALVRLVPRRLWRSATARTFRQYPADAVSAPHEGTYENLLEVTQRAPDAARTPLSPSA